MSKLKMTACIVSAALAVTIAVLNAFGVTHLVWLEGCTIGVVAGMAIEGLPE